MHGTDVAPLPSLGSGATNLNANFANPPLRKPVSSGTAGAGSIAEIVNRGSVTAGYENRRKTSSGGQRF